VTVRVAEGSGRPVERQIVKALTPSAPLIGVKPLFDGVVGEGSEARFSLIGVGPDEEPAPMQVTWELTRLETTYQWYQQYGVELGAGDHPHPRVAKARDAGRRRACGTRDPGHLGRIRDAGRTQRRDARRHLDRFYAGWYAPPTRPRHARHAGTVAGQAGLPAGRHRDASASCRARRGRRWSRCCRTG
jgi:alpha-2-macroglobulin